MYEAPGIGLAAIQVGEPRRIITIDVAREEERKPLFLINPEIVWSSEDERSTYEEGCLSIPDYYAEVERPAKVRVPLRRLSTARRRSATRTGCSPPASSTRWTT